MRRIREVLRLHLQAELSFGDIGRALKISKSVAAKYASLARIAGVDWALVERLTDEEFQARLYRPTLPRSSHQLAPDFALVHQELKRAASPCSCCGRSTPGATRGPAGTRAFASSTPCSREA